MGLLSEAEHHYLYDATFHARVEQAVQVINFDVKTKTGSYMNEADLSLATLAGAVGLLMAERHPSTGERL